MDDKINRDRTNKLLFMTGSTFASAEWAYGTAKAKRASGKYGSDITIPALVIQTSTACAMHCLSVELALKLLIELSTGEDAPRTHDLAKLFLKLNSSEKEKFVSEVGDCEEFFLLNKTGFEDWRYFHDSKPKNDRVIIDISIVKRIIKYIEERHQASFL